MAARVNARLRDIVSLRMYYDGYLQPEDISTCRYSATTNKPEHFVHLPCGRYELLNCAHMVCLAATFHGAIMYEEKNLGLKILGLVLELNALEREVNYEEYSAVKKQLRYQLQDRIVPAYTVFKMFNDHGIEL